LAIRPGNEFAGFDSEASAWYSFTFDDNTALQRWDLEIRAPIGRELTARLLDAAGAELERGNADEHGLILFADLAPDPTTWYVELTTPEPGFVHAIGTRAVGLRVEGEEAEPNDQFALANRIELSQPLTGRIGPGDAADQFVFRVDEAMAEQLMTLRLDGMPSGDARFCLLTADGVEAQCRGGPTPIELPDLMLGAGDWGLRIGDAPTDIEYSVALQAQGPIEDGVEAEPNDSLAFASGLPSSFRVRGRFAGDDTDFYQLVITDEAQLWRFQVVGEEIFEVGYYNGDGRQKATLRAEPGQRRLRLDDLFLLPGRHYLRVQGRDGGEYTLLARAAGPPNPDGELEPNDASNRQRLAFGQTRVGLLADPTDADHYRFFLAHWDHIRLTVQPPADGVVDPDITWYDQAMADGQLYIPFINNSLVAFSSQVVRGREAVNLIPFAMQPLLREWYGEPYALQTMLNDYRPGLGSSSAEWTLKTAAQALAPRAGTKANVVITDAETPHDGEMWMEMQTVQPRIFSMGVAGALIDEQNRLRDWASVNGGHFTQLIYEGEMEVAFDRATTLMQRPAGYTLMVESEFRELPGPGRLSVVAGQGGDSGGGAAVELILDASGSMLQRMDGRRRIDIAKEVLTGAARDLIPAGTPLALRVFGHREPDACRTDLEIPLGPLNPGAAAATIDGIQAMNLARTPIADSLAAVEADLGGTAGGAVVVLVTDGEETCNGNPESVITSLRDRGVDVSLNIVGFAIDDVELAAQFEAWAELGGGRYFAANDPEDLSDALEVALRVLFTVYDQGGNEVAVGEVGGDPVELEQGVYRVVVNTAERRIFDAVEVQGESDVELVFD
jgi:hypothetical protein